MLTLLIQRAKEHTKALPLNIKDDKEAQFLSCVLTASLRARAHTHTQSHTLLVFSHFQKRDPRCSMSLGWVRHRMEKKVGMFWFAFYTVAGFAYKSRQVLQIISHSCITSLSHIFSCQSSDDKSWKSWAKFFSTMCCILCL